MSELDIYDPPCSTTEVPVAKSPGFIRGKFTEYSTRIKCEVNEKREKCANVEEKVLSTVRPVTRFIPITYDTVKRVSVISLCTLSGVLQGRKSGGFRRILYPLCGFVGGSTACYPKQTYAVTSKTLTTTLPLVATVGKATVDGSSFLFHQTKKASSSIYQKVKEQLSDNPVEETIADESKTVETIKEAVLIDDSAECLEDTVSSEDSSTTQPVPEEVVQTEELAQEQVECSDGSPDTVISLEQLPVPTDVPPIAENLGMGDRDHDDMYSTRSARS